MKMSMRARITSAAQKAGVAFTGLAASGAAFAQSTGPDTGGITTLITEYGAEAVALSIAFIIVLWGVHATGLLRPKR